eukprot:6705-Eustigmatos_ZCMA.PRE.1
MRPVMVGMVSRGYDARSNRSASTPHAVDAVGVDRAKVHDAASRIRGLGGVDVQRLTKHKVHEGRP